MIQRISPATVRRALFAAFLLAIATFTAVPPSEAAPPGNCTFYSDASKTTVVGQNGYDCCNNRISWGRTSSYYTCGGCFLCVPPDPR
jgi:hypothetical protein